MVGWTRRAQPTLAPTLRPAKRVHSHDRRHWSTPAVRESITIPKRCRTSGRSRSSQKLSPHCSSSRRRRRRSNNGSVLRVFGHRWQVTKRSTSRAHETPNNQPFLSAGVAGGRQKPTTTKNRKKRRERAQRQNKTVTTMASHNPWFARPHLPPPVFQISLSFRRHLLASSTLCRMYACKIRLSSSSSPRLFYAARTPPNREKFGEQLPHKLQQHPTSFDNIFFQNQTSKPVFSTSFQHQFSKTVLNISFLQRHVFSMAKYSKPVFNTGLLQIPALKKPGFNPSF